MSVGFRFANVHRVLGRLPCRHDGPPSRPGVHLGKPGGSGDALRRLQRVDALWNGAGPQEVRRVRVGGSHAPIESCRCHCGDHSEHSRHSMGCMTTRRPIAWRWDRWRGAASCSVRCGAPLLHAAARPPDSAGTDRTLSLPISKQTPSTSWTTQFQIKLQPTIRQQAVPRPRPSRPRASGRASHASNSMLPER
jgi:hypothetical protein